MMSSPNYVSADAAVSNIKSGERVFLHSAAATPQLLVDALTARGHELEGVELVSIHTEGPAPYLDPRYAGVEVPATESLKDTIARVLPYYESSIAPHLKAGATVLVSAHGNSLRALVKHLSGISDEEITGLEIPTGQPIVYELDEDLNAQERYYLSEK